jgi:RNA polymerase sigma-70 factor (ECF subfamily)
MAEDGPSRAERAAADDEAALVRCCQHDRSAAAFRVLYDRHKDRVMNVVYHLIGDYDEALEATQEVFLRVYRKIRRFRGRSSFASWVYRIAVNVAADHRRRLGRDRTLLERYSRRGPPADGRERRGLDGASDAQAAEREQAARVREALAAISPKLAAVLALRYLEGQSYTEISATLRVSVGTVKSRLSRAHDAVAPLIEGLQSAAEDGARGEDHEG